VAGLSERYAVDGTREGCGMTDERMKAAAKDERIVAITVQELP
jgi:hypothetical protein